MITKTVSSSQPFPERTVRRVSWRVGPYNVIKTCAFVPKCRAMRVGWFARGLMFATSAKEKQKDMSEPETLPHDVENKSFRSVSVWSMWRRKLVAASTNPLWLACISRNSHACVWLLVKHYTVLKCPDKYTTMSLPLISDSSVRDAQCFVRVRGC